MCWLTVFLEELCSKTSADQQPFLSWNSECVFRICAEQTFALSPGFEHV